VGVDVIRRSSKNTLITACGTSSNIPLATAKSMAKLKTRSKDIISTSLVQEIVVMDAEIVDYIIYLIHKFINLSILFLFYC
jgi:hypothetical protein